MVTVSCRTLTVNTLELLAPVKNDVNKGFMLMITKSPHNEKTHAIHSEQVARYILLFCLVIGGISGCASFESLDMSSYDPAHNQDAIAGYYHKQAIAMQEKAKAQATAAAHYEALFSPEADWVSGARLLSRYYEQAARELEHLAEAHATVARTGKRPMAAQ